MSEHDPIASSAHLAGVVAGIGAHRIGAGAAVAELVEQGIEAIVNAVLRHHDPAALARDLAAEAAHMASTRAVIQAALDAGGRRE